MKNTKTAWKLFFAMIKQNKLIWMAVILSVLGIAILVIVGFKGDPIGNEEHLLSASFTGISYYMIYFGLFFTFIGFTNNRFFISCPESKAVITKVLPLVGITVNLALMVISVGFALIGGHTPQMLSDVLIFNAMGTLLTQLAMSLVTIQFSFIMVYFCFIPYVVLILTTDSTSNEFLTNLHLYGFGVPVEISAVIYIAALVIPFLLSFKLADFAYGKRTVRLMNAAAQNPLMSK